MRLAKVVGNVVSTRKTELLLGKKLMCVKYYGDGINLKNEVDVVSDCVGAGIGDKVLVVRGGSAASLVFGEKRLPLDGSIIGIVDTVEIVEGITE